MNQSTKGTTVINKPKRCKIKPREYYLGSILLKFLALEIQTVHSFGETQDPSKGLQAPSHLGPLLLTWLNFNPSMDT